MRIGVDHLAKSKRTALTDIDWMKNMTAMFGWLTSGDVRTFALAERDAAIAWAAGSRGSAGSAVPPALL